jgi:hypothetical protein
MDFGAYGRDRRPSDAVVLVSWFCSPVSGIRRIHFPHSISPDEPSNVRSVKVRFAKADSGKRRPDRSQ